MGNLNVEKARFEMKTNEMKIIEYNDGKHSYYRVLMYDTKRRFWREITSDNANVAGLTLYAQAVFNDINGGFDRVKMLKNSEYGVMLNGKKQSR